MSKQLRKTCTIALTIAFFVFQMYLALVKQLTIMLQTPLHMCFALALVFLYNPIDKGYQKKLKKKAAEQGRTPTDAELNKWAKLRVIDIAFFVGIAFVVFYTITNVERLRGFDKVVSQVLTIDYVAMAVIIVLLLEAVRRTLGNILFGFIIVFIIYAWTAKYFPKSWVLYTKGKSFPKMLRQFCAGMTLTESGVYGTPLTTSCTSLFYFIVFGAFFSECGGGQLLIDVGLKFSNKSSGGPAKAAVISSGLMGMVSGSAVANVATTGVMTIPMMKKIGYEPEEAGAIEAVASTGGQIMPPIMGVGAFIMAEMLGVNYLSVAASAIIPAVAYYFGVFVLVTYLAKKRASRAGGSEDAYAKIRSWGVDALDCVRGPYEGKSAGSNLFWRDAGRRKNNGLEHSVVTTGEAIQTYLPASIRRDHEEGYSYPQNFAEDGAPAGGEAAGTVTVPFSSYKTGVFTYDVDSGRYLVEEYGKAYVDGDTGEQVGVTNVLVLRTACKATGDSLGHITVDLTGGGDGWFACGGRLIPICWSKADRNSPLVYTTADGQPLVLGQGSTYVNIIPRENEITWE